MGLACLRTSTGRDADGARGKKQEMGTERRGGQGLWIDLFYFILLYTFFGGEGLREEGCSKGNFFLGPYNTGSASSSYSVV